MKKKIRKTLQSLESRPMPDRDAILAACPTVPIVSKESRKRTIRTHRMRVIGKAFAYAMSAMLIIGGSIGVSVEVQAYNEAMDFFKEYNLSAEGFTRSEVKKIYKDIVSKSFTYEKTEEALASGLEGYEIQTKPLDSDSLNRLWLTWYQYKAEEKDEDPVSQYYYSHGHYGGLPYMNHGISLCQYKNKGDKYKDRLWEIYLDNLWGEQCVATPTGVLLIGRPGYNDEDINYKLRVYSVNDDSTEAWRKDLDCPLAKPEVHYLTYDDGIITVYATQREYNYLWIAKMDLDGNIIDQEMLDAGTKIYGIDKLEYVGDSCMILTSSGELVRITDHQVKTSMNYNNGEDVVRISDMVVYNGLVYLSGNISTEWSKEYELYKDQFGENGTTDKKAQIEFAKEHHSAVLLICDPETGEPVSFYTVSGAEESLLEVKDGKLVWSVNRFRAIANVTFNGDSTADKDYYWYTGSFPIKADIWKYVFNYYGQLVGEKDTHKSITLEIN